MGYDFHLLEERLEIVKHRLAAWPLADAVAVERVAVVGRLLQCGSERETPSQGDEFGTEFHVF